MAEPKPKTTIVAASVGESVASPEWPADARLTPEMAETVIGFVEGYLRESKLPQRTAAKQLCLRQPTINRLVKKRAGVGVDVLLALRRHCLDLGNVVTIEQLLGLRSPIDELTDAYKALEQRYADMISILQAIAPADELSARRKKKLIADARAARVTAGTNRGILRRPRTSGRGS